ncbi:MAG: hypothetical protein RJQ10_04515 [Haliea sp.]
MTQLKLHNPSGHRTAGRNVEVWCTLSSLMQTWWQRATRATSIRLNGFVKNTFVNIAGKLPRGLVALYGDINEVAKSLDIDSLAVVMSVLGFTEAMETAFSIQISDNPDMTISVASLAGVAMLKLVAWVEREVAVKPRNAMDLVYLMES